MNIFLSSHLIRLSSLAHVYPGGFYFLKVADCPTPTESLLVVAPQPDNELKTKRYTLYSLFDDVQILFSKNLENLIRE